jgi:hypothetical protein
MAGSCFAASSEPPEYDAVYGHGLAQVFHLLPD